MECASPIRSDPTLGGAGGERDARCDALLRSVLSGGTARTLVIVAHPDDFQSRPWVAAWCRHFLDRGRGASGRPRAVQVRRNGRLIALAWLYRTRGPVQEWQLVGAGNTDRLDPLLEPASRNRAAEALLDALSPLTRSAPIVLQQQSAEGALTSPRPSSASGDRIIGCHYGFRSRNTEAFYIGGFDPEFRALSPGKLLIADAVERALGYRPVRFPARPGTLQVRLGRARRGMRQDHDARMTGALRRRGRMRHV